ncbi:hypothetical protein ElyMa_001281900 [Elysia marginata]|uniref:Uncharacterized protein n=1 Tax=Elysia marginata TaxID=1093978 RepID=A0AAV4IJ70_9GAST|nr:hypothetical protein ElyMa_001281900 [Elysia marginata]
MTVVVLVVMLLLVKIVAVEMVVMLQVVMIEVNVMVIMMSMMMTKVDVVVWGPGLCDGSNVASGDDTGGCGGSNPAAKDDSSSNIEYVSHDNEDHKVVVGVAVAMFPEAKTTPLLTIQVAVMG